MNYKRKKYCLFIIAIVVLVSIGYALINTTLKLNGTGSIKKARWDIYFDNVEHESGVTSTQTKIDSKKTTVSFDIDLAKPGDYYQFNVDTVNDGTIDAIIDSTELTGLSETTNDIIDYTVTYADGSSVNRCDTLNSGTRKTLLVKVKYFDNVTEEDLLEEAENLKLKFKINYVQTGVCSREPLLEIDPNGGKYNNSRKVTKQNVTKNTSVTIPGAEKDGYDFVNWQTSTGTDLEKDSETGLTTINVGTSDIKVIAQWQQKIDPATIKHTITIDPNGGLYNDSEEVVTYQKKKNETVEVNGTIEREGYIFKGWSVDPADSSFVGNVLTVGLVDVTITATWELDEEHVVAKIENRYYTTLQKAFNAAVTGDKIELLKDITEVSTNTKEVSLDLGNHTINGTINNSGILTVDNGKIQNLTVGQAPIVNTGTIIIGTEDEIVVQDSIILYGKTTGLLQNGQFYFYDGYIEGDIAFKGGYNGCAAGHIVYVDYDNILNCQKAYLTKTDINAKVKIKNPGSQGGADTFIFYKSLGMGISNTTNTNPDVYLLQSFSDSEDITIADEQILNINLEGYTLEEGAHIINNGTLTIKDTAQNRGTFSLGTYSIENHGTFNLSNVNVAQTMNSINTIDNYGDLNFSNSTIQSVNGYALNNNTTGTLTFTNDTYFSSTGGYSFYNDATEEVILTGGNFQGIHNKGTNLIVDGATVTNPSNNYAINNDLSSAKITLKNVSANTTNKYVLYNKGTTNVESGTYEATSTYTFYNYSSSTLNITGGTIKCGGQYTVNNNGTLKISGSPTISNTYNSTSGAAVYVYSGDATIDGGIITSLKNYAVYKYSGGLNIKGGNISNDGTSSPAVYIRAGTATISGGNIISNNNVGVSHAGSTLDIKGGSIKGKTYGLYINYSSAIANIGINDDNVDPSLPDRTPVIVGDTYGVYKNNGTLNFYDGILKGKNNSVYYGEVNEVSDGSEILKGTETIEGEQYYTAYLYVQDDFLEITGVGTYNSLSAAIKKINDDLGKIGTIKVYQAGKISSPATIPSGNNITLDLNGIKVTSSVVITNEGTFHIVDDSIDDGTGKKGEIENVVSDIIKNKKTLIIDEGIFTATNGKIIDQSGGYSSDTNHYTTINNGTFNGGSVYSNYPVSIGSGKINVNGGSFSSNNNYTIYISSGTNEIKNATIKNSNSYAVKIYNGSTTTFDNVTINDSKRGVEVSGTLYLNNSNITTIQEGLNVSTGGNSYANPKLYVTNSNITSGTDGISVDRSTLVFYSGTINADDDGIYNYRSNTKVIDGTICGKNRGIYISSDGSTHTTLGDDENSIIADTTKPVIIGDNYGIYAYEESGQNNINFYDGIIKSKGTQVFGTITTMPVGYITTNGIDSLDSSYKTTYLTTQLPFIHAGGEDYSSLQSAINAAANSDGKMTLIRDGMNTNDATIDSTQNITLDLNGFTLTNTKSITNNGTLTINDDSGNGNIINLSFTSMFSNSSTLVINNGNYNVNKNILIEQTSNNSSFTLNGGNLLGVNDKIIDNKGKFTMNGGTINWTGDYNPNPIVSDDGDITITGGTIGNNTSRVIEVIRMSYNTHTLEINGDAIIIAGNGKAVSLTGTGNKMPNLSITGGTISSETSDTIYINRANASINGGSITSNGSRALYVTSISTVDIKGGEIIGKTYGLYQDGSSTNVTLGDNNSEVKLTPVLKGDTYGAYIKSGAFNFYDGILKGKNSNVYYGNITATANNYDIGSGTEIDPETGETYYTKYLIPTTEFVWNKTKGPDAKYTDLQIAITEASNNDELELVDNGTVYSEIIIPNKTLKLDLNNFNISISQPITNNGTFTIIDENTNGTKGTISTIGTFDLIKNNSNLTIDNVSLENLYENYYIIDNKDSATLTLNNADITGKYGIKNNTGSTLTSTNSNITSTYYYTIYNDGGTIDITGGEMKNTSNDYYSEDVLYLYSDSTNPGDVTIRNTSILKNQSYYDCIYASRYDNLKLYNVITKGKVVIGSNSEIEYDGGTLTGYINNSGNMTINNLTLNAYQNYGISNSANISKKNKITNSNITINRASEADYDGIRNNGKLVISNTNITLTKASSAAGIRNYGSGQFELKGGNISVSRDVSGSSIYGIYNDTSSSVNNIIRPNNIIVSGATTGYGIYNTNGTLTMLSGKVTVSDAVNSYGIYQTGGEVIMGTYDGSRDPSGDVSTTTPYIKAEGTTGIGETKTGGEFRFFDGRIEGSTDAITSAPSQIEPNYIVQTYTSVATGNKYAILECLTQQSISNLDWSIKLTDNDIVKERVFSIDNLTWLDTNNDPVSQLQYGATSNIKIKLDSISMSHKYNYTIMATLADGSPIEVSNNNITGTMDIPTETEKTFNLVLTCASSTADYTNVDKDVLVTITFEEIE